MRVNQLLKYINREIRIPKPKVIPTVKKYLTLEEMYLVLPELRDDFDRDAVVSMLGTGMREGELFGAKPENLKKQVIGGQVKYAYLVNTQMKRDRKPGLPKREKVRVTIVHKFAVESFKRWLTYPAELKKKNRVTFSRRLLDVTRKVFDLESKHISDHRLRASFIIYCRSLDLSWSDISDVTGDDVKVLKESYAGFSAPDEVLKNILGKI